MQESKPISVEESEKALISVFNELRDLVVKKNRTYAASVFNPRRIFSKADAMTGILVRLDDKLNRLQADPSAFDEKPEIDIIGYLVIKLAYEAIQKERSLHA